MLSIPLSEIKPWENNKSLRGIKHEGFDRIKKNLQLGQHTPLLVYKNENNEYICIGGNHRLMAMKELNYAESDCMLLTFESDENGFYGVINGKVYRDKEGKIGKYYKSVDQGLIEFSFSHNMSSAFYLEDEVLNYVGSLPDIDWSLYNADFEPPVTLADWEKKELDDLYTRNIVSPIYAPSNFKPDIVELVEGERTEKLLADIDASNVSEDEKKFLRFAAYRHNVFDYAKIADYYSNSSPEMKKLMEDSALIIIDFRKAIELGYIELTKGIAEVVKEDYNG